MQRAHTSRFTPAASLALAAWMCALPLGAAIAQPSAVPPQQSSQPAAPRDIPRPDQLEPGVSTTPLAPAAPPDTPATNAAAPASPAGAAPRSAPAAGGTAPKDTAATPKAAATASGASARKGPDRLQLDATEITGNRELPKVLYIVPWKRSDLGDLEGRPVNSLLDEVLQPLDRDVFQRENRYYNALQPDAAAPRAAPAQGAESKP
jgi:hypothetical protein